MENQEDDRGVTKGSIEVEDELRLEEELGVEEELEAHRRIRVRVPRLTNIQGMGPKWWIGSSKW